MHCYHNSLPYREYIIIGSPECGYIGFGWPIRHDCYRRRRRCRKHRHHRYYHDSCSHYPYSRYPFFRSHPSFQSYGCADQSYGCADQSLDGCLFPPLPYCCEDYPF
ncbi:MAG TPA: hypothetical protein PKA10_11780 [Selenomonadales bacterium]|nr:hypothetical protein [Selenomonadales bacterium]